MNKIQKDPERQKINPGNPRIGSAWAMDSLNSGIWSDSRKNSITVDAVVVFKHVQKTYSVYTNTLTERKRVKDLAVGEAGFKSHRAK